MKPHLLLTACTLMGLLSSHVVCSAEQQTGIQGPKPKGVLGEKELQTWILDSPLQESAQPVEVLLPSNYTPQKKYPVLYLLPVTAGPRGKWGAGILEAIRHEIADRHQVICVQPSFHRSAYIANHPTDENIQQETYFLDVVIPHIEATYSTMGKHGRYLAGFSKSGNAVFHLALRHPHAFSGILSFDAPYGLNELKWEMSTVFGTREHLQKYVPLTLLEAQDAARTLQGMKIILMGSDLFDPHVQGMRAQLKKLNISHTYDRRVRERKHHWDGGWFKQGTDHLFKQKPELPRKLPARLPHILETDPM